MPKLLGFLLVGLTLCVSSFAQKTPEREPVIDMHEHALPANYYGPPPSYVCAPYDYWPAWDPQTGGMAYAAMVSVHPPCAKPLKSAETDDGVMQGTLAMLQKYNVTAVTNGELPLLNKWKAAGGARILPATYWSSKEGPTIEELRQLVKSKQIMAFAELGQQYDGVPANDPSLEPLYALAEELDVPVGIHMGPGPPGMPYFGAKGYRMRMSSLLLLEDVLVKHPKLRVWAMHAGWPLIDDAIAALYAHPQLYVDLGVISYTTPRAEFYRYLQRLIEAGFENRIMFGSDQMLWPDSIGVAIENIENAPFLTHQQKRDILYNNAARFLRIVR
jgi:predicted TIM-barrel fold metal-dependent hydrolase